MGAVKGRAGKGECSTAARHLGNWARYGNVNMGDGARGACSCCLFIVVMGTAVLLIPGTATVRDWRSVGCGVGHGPWGYCDGDGSWGVFTIV